MSEATLPLPRTATAHPAATPVAEVDTTSCQPATPDIEPEEDDDTTPAHRVAPVPDPACLYGLIGDIAHAGSQNTEANPYAVAASAIAYLSAAVGRGPYVSLGDDWNHPRLFLVHVGRSSLGRKGTAKKLIKRIHEALAAQDATLVPQVHTGGLSSREGLAMLIHDGYKDGKIEVPPVEDKRLLVMESEFANVLHQTKRDGNTLSSALRDAWDGTDIAPAVKHNPVWAKKPHIVVMGDITPTELIELMGKRELTNGFANRFLFFWAESNKMEAFPQPTPDSIVNSLADRVAEVVRFAGAQQHGCNNTMPIQLSREAKPIYGALNKKELRSRSAGERLTSLLDRRIPTMQRLAMLFALTDQSQIISVAHVNAAMAWVRYWVESVKFIFQTAEDVARAASQSRSAQRILAYLTQHKQATRTDLNKKCFGGHATKTQLDNTLDTLLSGKTPAIEVTTISRPPDQPGSPITIYTLARPAHATSQVTSHANTANSAKCEASTATEGNSDDVRTQRSVRTEAPAEQPHALEFAQFAGSANLQILAPTPADAHTSQTSQPSHHSHTPTEKPRSVLVGVLQ